MPLRDAYPGVQELIHNFHPHLRDAFPRFMTPQPSQLPCVKKHMFVRWSGIRQAVTVVGGAEKHD